MPNLKSILVTGGAGFIGSHLVAALLGSGHRVRVLDNLVSGTREWVPETAEFIQGSVADAATCDAAMVGMDGVCHLAAMSRVTTDLGMVGVCTQSNIVGTQNILMAAKKYGVRKVVYSGSSTYYGNQPVPHREEVTPPELLTFYGVTKAAGEQYCLMFDKFYDVPCIVLRYFNAYGPRQPETGVYALVLGIFLKRYAENQPLELHGGGTQRRDFVHVRDIVRANIMALESPARGMVLNVGCGVSHSIKDIADLISDNQIIAPARAGDARETLADISRIKTILGWQPSVSLADGVAELKGLMKA